MTNTLELMEPETSTRTETATGHQLKGVIKLPLGLLGFEHVKNYVLLDNPLEEPFMWLQMAEDAKHAFLVVSPTAVVADYQPDINERDVAFLDLAGPEDAFILNIVTLRNGRATVNLKGPIVINKRTLMGKQVIPNNAQRFNVRHLLAVS
jgi:flagellar assembly factor FliW